MSTRFQQSIHHLVVTHDTSLHKGRNAILVTKIHIGSLLQEELDHLQMSHGGRGDERCHAIPTFHVRSCIALLKQFLKHFLVTIACGSNDTSGGRCHGRDIRFGGELQMQGRVRQIIVFAGHQCSLVLDPSQTQSLGILAFPFFLLVVFVLCLFSLCQDVPGFGIAQNVPVLGTTMITWQDTYILGLVITILFRKTHGGIRIFLFFFCNIHIHGTFVDPVRAR
mmetsp:Transcript_1426/g.3533  ORF Transcript_1426/g.3533 Transcript_1426/m.3533 type:complete len:223 (-) Transcript_1426:50-718(-)